MFLRAIYSSCVPSLTGAALVTPEAGPAHVPPVNVPSAPRLGAVLATKAVATTAGVRLVTTPFDRAKGAAV